MKSGSGLFTRSKSRIEPLPEGYRPPPFTFQHHFQLFCVTPNFGSDILILGTPANIMEIPFAEEISITKPPKASVRIACFNDNRRLIQLHGHSVSEKLLSFNKVKKDTEDEIKQKGAKAQNAFSKSILLVTESPSSSSKSLIVSSSSSNKIHTPSSKSATTISPSKRGTSPLSRNKIPQSSEPKVVVPEPKKKPEPVPEPKDFVPEITRFGWKPIPPDATTKKFVATSKRRYGILCELIETEKFYIEDLEWVMAEYQAPMIEKGQLSRQDSQTLFVNIPLLSKLNSIFLSALEERLDEWHALNLTIGQVSKSPEGISNANGDDDYVLYDTVSVGHIFSKMADSFRPFYSEFCAKYPESQEVEAKLFSTSSFQKMDSQKISRHPRRLGLKDITIEPMQRICQYPLLIKDLLKRTPKTHSDYKNLKKSLADFEDVVGAINEHKRLRENSRKILDLAERIRGLVENNIDLIQPGRRILFEGILTKINRQGISQERYFVLFNDCILYASQKKLGRSDLVYKGMIPLRYLILRPLKDSGTSKNIKHAFQLIRVDINRIFALMASDEKSKQQWLAAIQSGLRALAFSDLSHVQQNLSNSPPKPPKLRRPTVVIPTHVDSVDDIQKINSSFISIGKDLGIKSSRVVTFSQSEMAEITAQLHFGDSLDKEKIRIQKILAKDLPFENPIDNDDQNHASTHGDDDSSDEDEDEEHRTPRGSDSPRSNSGSGSDSPRSTPSTPIIEVTEDSNNQESTTTPRKKGPTFIDASSLADQYSEYSEPTSPASSSPGKFFRFGRRHKSKKKAGDLSPNTRRSLPKKNSAIQARFKSLRDMNIVKGSFSIVLLGNPVGKTSIIKRFLDDEFLTIASPTLEDEYVGKISIPACSPQISTLRGASQDRATYSISITDTGGDSVHARNHSRWIKSAHSIILVFSYADSASFDALPKWYESIMNNWQFDFADPALRKQHSNQPPNHTFPLPVTLVGTCVDVHPSSVLRSKAISFATMINAPLLECSSKTGENISQIFISATQQAYRVRNIRRLWVSRLDREKSSSDSLNLSTKNLAKLMLRSNFKIKVGSSSSQILSTLLKSEKDLPSLFKLFTTAIDTSSGALFFATKTSLDTISPVFSKGRGRTNSDAGKPHLSPSRKSARKSTSLLNRSLTGSITRKGAQALRRAATQPIDTLDLTQHHIDSELLPLTTNILQACKQTQALLTRVSTSLTIHNRKNSTRKKPESSPTHSRSSSVGMPEIDPELVPSESMPDFQISRTSNHHGHLATPPPLFGRKGKGKHHRNKRRLLSDSLSLNTGSGSASNSTSGVLSSLQPSSPSSPAVSSTDSSSYLGDSDDFVVFNVPHFPFIPSASARLISNLSNPLSHFVLNPIFQCPLLLIALLGFIEAKFTKTVGIFRLVGSRARTKYLYEKFMSWELSEDCTLAAFPSKSSILVTPDLVEVSPSGSLPIASSTDSSIPKTRSKINSHSTTLANSSLFFYLPASLTNLIAAEIDPQSPTEMNNTDALCVANILYMYLNDLDIAITPNVYLLMMEASSVHFDQLSAATETNHKSKKSQRHTGATGIFRNINPRLVRNSIHQLSATVSPFLQLLPKPVYSSLFLTIMSLSKLLLPNRHSTLLDANLLAGIFSPIFFRPDLESFQNNFSFKNHKEILKALLLFPPPEWQQLWEHFRHPTSFVRPPPPPKYTPSDALLGT